MISFIVSEVLPAQRPEPKPAKALDFLDVPASLLYDLTRAIKSAEDASQYLPDWHPGRKVAAAIRNFIDTANVVGSV